MKNSPTNEEQYVKLNHVNLNSQPVSENNLIRIDKQILGVRLDDFEEGQQCNLDFNYELPDSMTKTDKIVLRAEMVQRKITIEEN